MKKNYVLIVLAIALVLPGCKIMYVPNMQNVPLMREKGEIRATVGPSNVQGAYAVTENLGTMVNAQFRSTKFTVASGSYETKYETKRWLAEAGGGYFMPLGEKGVFEVYGGGGYGGVTFNRMPQDSSGQYTVSDKYNANMIKTFIQPAIGLTAENVDFSFSLRYTGIKFNSIDTIGYTQFDLVDEEIAGIEKPFYSFVEPAVTVRIGFEYVKFHTQLIYSHKVNVEQLNRSPLSLNFGVHLTIAPRNKE